MASAVHRLTPDRVKAIAPGEPRLEFEQAFLRVVISGAIFGYVAWYVERGDQALFAALFFFVFALAVATRIVQAPGISRARRILCMLVDNAIASYGIFVLGEDGAVILGTYLFVTLGNGFRFGNSYLYSSQILSVVGFAIVIWMSPFWSQHKGIGIGFIAALIVVPIYVGVLAHRIKVARRRADNANEAKGRFLAHVSHEMRTPLNGVIAMADVLRETSLNESQSEIVDTLGTSAHLLLAQIEDVLDMAKIEAGRVQIEQRPFDLSALVTTTVKVILPQARYKDLTVNTSISADVARWFAGDAHHLRQVLLNLLANAVKFTERGQILLSVSLADQATNEAPALVRFEVRDTGIGIALKSKW